MKKIPGFFVCGFLESGKTTYIINNLLKDDRCDKYKSLILCCEEGEVEYTQEFLKKTNSVVRYLESMEDFDYKNINKILSETKPERVFIEMNGMWPIRELLFPKCIELYQTILFIDTKTFPIYFQNMRQTFVDNITNCRIVAFTHLDDLSEISQYQTQLKLINKDAGYFTLDKDGNVSEAFEEPLPYDLESPVIELDDNGFATFYIDSYDHPERYEGKTVSFDGQAFLSKTLPLGTFVIGRKIMNCCANDVQLFGLLAKTLNGVTINHKGWVHIKASITFKYSEQYQENELILTPSEIVEIEPKEEILNLTN